MGANKILVMRGRVLLSVVIVVAAVCGAWAIDGRDFAGTYATSNEIESGESVRMTFTTEIFNYSGADISGATVRLESPTDPRNPYATFASVSVAARSRVRLEQEMEVPVRERDAWRKGAVPRLTVEYVDGEGKTHRRPVELMRGQVRP